VFVYGNKILLYYYNTTGWRPLKKFKCGTEQNCTEMWMYVSWVTMSEPLVALPLFAV